MPKKTTTPKEVIKEEVAAKIPTLIAPNSQVTITIPWDKIDTAYKAVLVKAAKTVKTDGFRLGKVPPHIAEGMLDQSKLYDQVIQQLFPEIYIAEIQRTGKKPISQPDVEPVSTEPNADWTFTVSFAERPEIDLKNYQQVISEATEDAQKEISEKQAELKKEVKSADADSEKSAESSTPKELTQTQQDDIRLKHIFRSLAETLKPQIPELLIRHEVTHELQHLVEQLKQLNIKVEDYLSSRQMTAEQLEQEYAAMALSSLQIEFIIAEIAKDQKMTVEESEIDAAFDQMGGSNLSEADRKNPDTRSYVFSSLLKQKVIQKLLNK